MTRVQLRRTMRERRRALSPARRVRYSVQLSRRVQGLAVYRNSRRVAVYLANDGEIDLAVLVQRAVAARKRCYLPVLCPLGGRRLWFAAYRPGEPLRMNRLHILEPKRPAAQWVRAACLDLVLVPLVAFDARGNRIGMGGGYYDKTLAFLAGRRYWRKPRVVGVGHDFQRVAVIKPRPWDVALDRVITESRVYGGAQQGGVGVQQMMSRQAK